MAEKYRIIDLSLPIETTNQEFIPHRIKPISHKKGAAILGLGGLISEHSWFRTGWNLFLSLIGFRKITAKDFPDGIGLAWERISLDTHTGTHLDAPWHFGPFVAGDLAKTIDQVPLDWCFGNGVLLDVTSVTTGQIEIKDIEKACRRIHYQVQEGDIVLLMTGAQEYTHEKKYLFRYRGISADGVRWFLDKGVKIIGTDAWGFDRPFQDMVRDYLSTRDKKHLWPAHLVGREREYCHIEKLVNLDKLPVPIGFKVACFPINIKGASAGWSRVVAILD
jgi:kynurenine formamidase